MAAAARELELLPQKHWGPVTAVAYLPTAAADARPALAAGCGSDLQLLVGGAEGAGPAVQRLRVLPCGLRVRGIAPASGADGCDGVAALVWGGCCCAMVSFSEPRGGPRTRWTHRFSAPVVAAASDDRGDVMVLTAQGSVARVGRPEAHPDALGLGLVTAGAFAREPSCLQLLFGTMAGRCAVAELSQGASPRVQELGGHAVTAHVRCCALHAAPGGSALAVTGGDDRALRWWRRGAPGPWAGAEAGEWRGHGGRVWGVACLGPTAAVSAGEDGAVLQLLFGTMAGRCAVAELSQGASPRVQELGGHAVTAHVRCCALHAAPGGSALAVTGGDDRALRWWRRGAPGPWAGAEAGEWRGHGGRVWGVACLGPTAAVSAGEDGAVLQWGVGSEGALRVLRGGDSAAPSGLSVAAAPCDGGRLAVGDFGGSVSELRLATPEAAQVAPDCGPSCSEQLRVLRCCVAGGGGVAECSLWAATAEGRLLYARRELPCGGGAAPLEDALGHPLPAAPGGGPFRATALSPAALPDGRSVVCVGDEAGRLSVVAVPSPGAAARVAAAATLQAKIAAVACSPPAVLAADATGSIAEFRLPPLDHAAEVCQLVPAATWATATAGPCTALAAAACSGPWRGVAGSRDGAVAALIAGGGGGHVVRCSPSMHRGARVTAATCASWGAATGDSLGRVAVWLAADGGTRLVATNELRHPSVLSDVLCVALSPSPGSVSAVCGMHGSNVVCYDPAAGELWRVAAAGAAKRSLSAQPAATGVCDAVVCFTAGGSAAHAAAPPRRWTRRMGGSLLRGDAAAVCFAAGAVCCAGDDGTIALQDPEGGDGTAPLELRGRHDSGVNALASLRLPNGVSLLASAGGGDRAEVWGLRPAEAVAVGAPAPAALHLCSLPIPGAPPALDAPGQQQQRGGAKRRRRGSPDAARAAGAAQPRRWQSEQQKVQGRGELHRVLSLAWCPAPAPCPDGGVAAVLLAGRDTGEVAVLGVQCTESDAVPTTTGVLQPPPLFGAALSLSCCGCPRGEGAVAAVGGGSGSVALWSLQGSGGAARGAVPLHDGGVNAVALRAAEGREGGLWVAAGGEDQSVSVALLELPGGTAAASVLAAVRVAPFAAAVRGVVLLPSPQDSGCGATHCSTPLLAAAAEDQRVALLRLPKGPLPPHPHYGTAAAAGRPQLPDTAEAAAAAWAPSCVGRPRALALRAAGGAPVLAVAGQGLELIRVIATR
eukprot:TRINITY_DN26646_c0_g1_i1.p1 TRINITY_DN26646_c0_g1~~TRINITY_DN26646_c0_g1_i1.p1  ORF type:complete len:1248 (+),score=225.25 TRINITY_DN26646_c0_g1_i1:81-3746(+)